ncbi:MAG: OmpH family outer membrane protein [Syntrophaceae bacterium]|nr:OmpH family outer membrane protein [Syntrophaceae bacterium]
MMKGKRLGVIIGIALILGGWVGPSLTAELKIGFVDIQRAVNECSAGKEAKKILTKEMEKFQRLIIEKQRELQAMKESLEKQAPMLNPEARAAKEKEYQAKLREFQRWGEDNQNEVNQKRIEMERNISLGLQKVIKKLGEDEGYALVLEKNENIVLFASKSIDLTDRVIKLFDAQKK